VRLTTWNVNIALRRKWPALLSLRPDVAVLQEVSEVDVSNQAASCWVGNDRNKGIAVVGFNGFNVRIHPAWNPMIEKPLGRSRSRLSVSGIDLAGALPPPGVGLSKGDTRLDIRSALNKIVRMPPLAPSVSSFQQRTFPRLVQMWAQASGFVSIRKIPSRLA
jgi:hypothetical protein